MKSLNNKTIWITGASSGIGEQLVYQLAREGATLIISARREKELEKVKEKANSDKIMVLPLDLSQPESLIEKAEIVLKQVGKIDGLIHNAGIACRDYAVDTQLAIDRRIMEINYFGTIALTKAVLPDMMKNKDGHLVIISSLSGKYGVPQLSAYAASKHALHGFFDSLRSEVSKDNIKISILIPGFIKTDITMNALKGDGTYYEKMGKVNENGMSAEHCAERIIKKIKQEKEEALIGGLEISSVYLMRFFPALFSKVMRNSPVKKWRSLARFFVRH